MFSSSAPASFEGFTQGTLLQMNHSMDPSCLKKSKLREALSHFGKVAYVDLHGKVVQQVTIRFANKAQTTGFISKATESEQVEDISEY